MRFIKRKRKGTFIEMAPVNVKEALELIQEGKVSFSETDKKFIETANPDLEAEWIARNPENHDDMRFVGIEYAAENYYPSENLSFGEAIDYLKKGFKVTREGWNGKDMFLFLVPGSKLKVSRPPLLGIYPEGTEISYHAHIDIKTAQGDIVPWLASQTDMLAEDWEIVQDIT